MHVFYVFSHDIYKDVFNGYSVHGKLTTFRYYIRENYKEILKKIPIKTLIWGLEMGAFQGSELWKSRVMLLI